MKTILALAMWAAIVCISLAVVPIAAEGRDLDTASTFGFGFKRNYGSYNGNYGNYRGSGWSGGRYGSYGDSGGYGGSGGYSGYGGYGSYGNGYYG